MVRMTTNTVWDMGQGPLVSIDEVEVGPDDLHAQLPVRLELLRVLPGPDRPDYVLARPSRAIRHATTVDFLESQGIDPAGADPRGIRIHPDGGVDLAIMGVVLAARFSGQAIHPGMRHFPIVLAYIIDNSQLRDWEVDFAKCLYVATAGVSDAAIARPQQVRRTASAG